MINIIFQLLIREIVILKIIKYSYSVVIHFGVVDMIFSKVVDTNLNNNHLSICWHKISNNFFATLNLKYFY